MVPIAHANDVSAGWILRVKGKYEQEQENAHHQIRVEPPTITIAKGRWESEPMPTKTWFPGAAADH